MLKGMLACLQGCDLCVGLGLFSTVPLASSPEDDVPGLTSRGVAPCVRSRGADHLIWRMSLPSRATLWGYINRIHFKIGSSIKRFIDSN